MKIIRDIDGKINFHNEFQNFFYNWILSIRSSKNGCSISLRVWRDSHRQTLRCSVFVNINKAATKRIVYSNLSKKTTFYSLYFGNWKCQIFKTFLTKLNSGGGRHYSVSLNIHEAKSAKSAKTLKSTCSKCKIKNQLKYLMMLLKHKISKIFKLKYWWCST